MKMGKVSVLFEINLAREEFWTQTGKLLPELMACRDVRSAALMPVA